MPDISALVIYDGDCVFCSNYVRFVRLQETVGPVVLVDARSADPIVGHYQRLGFDLNAGMLFVWRGVAYHGADAVYALAGLSSASTAFNRLNRAILSHRASARLLYPLLKLGRRAALMLRGKPLIPSLG
jgi:predicted DCC family thiol-disulfide oxidoreductase YuxK